MIQIEQYKTQIKIILILIIITALLAIISITITNSIKNDLNSYINLQEEYQDAESDFISYLPNIKFNTSDAEAANNEIEDNYKLAIDNQNIFTYQANLNDEYLSLVTFYIYSDINDNNYPKTIIKTYNFHIDTGKLATTEELLEEFDVTESDIINTLEQEFTSYYEQELESMYYTEDECNYECFLDLRGINSYSDNVSLYIDNNELYFYRPFAVYSRYKEEQFYRHEDFLFEVDK